SDTNAAIEQYLKALDVDPNLAELYARLTILFGRAGLEELARGARQRYALLRPLMAGTLKVTPGGPEVGIIPEAMFRRAWQRLPPVRPEPGLPSVADVLVNRAIQQRIEADRDGVFKAAFRHYERGQFAASAANFRAALESGLRDWITGYL